MMEFLKKAIFAKCFLDQCALKLLNQSRFLKSNFACSYKGPTLSEVHKF